MLVLAKPRNVDSNINIVVGCYVEVSAQVTRSNTIPWEDLFQFEKIEMSDQEMAYTIYLVRRVWKSDDPG
jgi:hypothetical protein